jgi:hypothetical protein
MKHFGRLSAPLLITAHAVGHRFRLAGLKGELSGEKEISLDGRPGRLNKAELTRGTFERN